MRSTVLIYSTAYAPYIGGAERAVEEITTRLAADFRFVLITARLSSKLPREELLGAVEVFRIGIGVPFIDKLLLAFFGARFARRVLKGAEIHTVWGIMASYGGLAALRYKERHPIVRFLLTLQEGDEFSYIEHRARFIRSRFKKIFSTADAVQAISHYLARWGERMGARVPVTVIPNGVDIEKFEYQNTKPKKDTVKLITTSRLVKKNAVDDCIRALTHLPQSVTLNIVGDGPDRPTLENLARELGVEERVIFLGSVESSRIPSLLAEADIFVRPSLSEGLGNSFLEAMAAGLPVIATNVGGIPDFLKDGETGWFAEVRSPESIAALVRLIMDPARTEQLTQVTTAARALIEREYQWDRIALNMKALL